MQRNKRLQKFDTLSLIDKMKIIKEHLVSPWLAVQLRGMQRIEDLLSNSRNPAERDYLLGLVTSAFSHTQNIRKWAAEILKTYYVNRWEYIGPDLQKFYEHKDSKGLINIVRKAVDILEQPEAALVGISTRDTPVFFQPNHRHGLDLLWLATEAGIFDWPWEIGDTQRSQYSDFIQQDFNREFPSIDVGEVLNKLLKTDRDPFVLRRIVDFLSRTALPVNNYTSAFDAILQTIQPSESKVDYFDQPLSYYQVVEYGIRGATLLVPFPWYQEIRISINHPLISKEKFENLLSFTRQMYQGYWPSERSWQELLSQYQDIDKELGNNLLNAYIQTNKNRERLVNVLQKIITSQKLIVNKPDLHKDLNCRDAFEAMGRLGAYEDLPQLWRQLETGMDCTSVSFMLQGWCFAVIRNLDNLTSIEHRELLKKVITLSGAKKEGEKYIKKVMGFSKLTPKEFGQFTKNNLRHVRNHLSKFYLWGKDEWAEHLPSYESVDTSIILDRLLATSIENYKLTDINSAERKEQNEELVDLWNHLLNNYKPNLSIDRTNKVESADLRHSPNGANGSISETTIRELTNIIQLELRQSPDRKTLIERTEKYSFLIDKLNISRQLQPFLPSEDELITISGIGLHLRLITDESIIENAFHKTNSVAIKLLLWLELLKRQMDNSKLSCPIALDANTDSTDDSKIFNLISNIPETIWHEAIPHLCKLTVEKGSGLEALIRGILRDARYRPLFGFQLGGINKFMRKHLSSEVAYLLFDEWGGETDVSDAELAKFAWINLIKAGEYALANQLPSPSGIQQSERIDELDLSGSYITQKLSKLEWEVTLPSVLSNYIEYLQDSNDQYHHQQIAFSSSLPDTEGIRRVTLRPLEYTSSFRKFIKNFHPGQELKVGDCVIGKITRLINDKDNHQKFLIDLGDTYKQGFWNEEISNLSKFQVFEKIDHFELFIIVSINSDGCFELSHQSLVAQFKDQLVDIDKSIELDVTVDEHFPNGSLKVLAGNFPLEIESNELTWGDPTQLSEVISYLQKRKIPVRVCLFRNNQKDQVHVSFKYKKPTWEIEDLAIRFGIQPVQLVYVKTEKNDLIFEVNPRIPKEMESQHELIPLGTLCRINIEKLVDKNEINYHPLLDRYAPQKGENFEAQWLLPIETEKSNRPWQQEQQAVLKIQRTIPFQYNLHREFRVNSSVVIEPDSDSKWSDKPENVRIVSPSFEKEAIQAILTWEALQEGEAEQLLKLENNKKVNAKIIRYQNGYPVVLPNLKVTTKFEKNQKYNLKVIQHSFQERRNKLVLMHIGSDQKLVIYEEQLGYNPEITLNYFPVGLELEAVFMEEKDGEKIFSLLHKSYIKTVISPEHLDLPIKGTYLDIETKGYEQFHWLETEPGHCLRIAIQRFDIKPKKFEAGDPVILSQGSQNSVRLKLQDQIDDNPIRKLLDTDAILDGVVVSESNQLIKVSPLNMRSLVGKLGEQQHNLNVGTRIKVKIDQIRFNFYSDLPKLKVTLTPLVQPKDQLGFQDFLKVWKETPRLHVWGRIVSHNTKELNIRLFDYGPDINFVAPYSHISSIQSRQDYRYYQSIAHTKPYRNFLVLNVDEESQTVTLSMSGGYSENLRRKGKINPELGIDKGNACLLEIVDNGEGYIFETANLVKCRIDAQDIDIDEDQRKEYLNWRYQGGLFDFVIRNDKVVLNSLPTLPIREVARSLKNQVLIGRLTKEGEQWRINFLGNALKKYVQLQSVRSYLDPQQQDNLPENLQEHKLVSVVLKRFDANNSIAYFVIWNQEEVQRNEVEVQVITPQIINSDWVVQAQNTQRRIIHFKQLTAASSLKQLSAIGDSKKFFHSGTLNFDPESWYRAIFVKTEKYSYISFRDCEFQNISALDRYFLENPKDTRIILTLIKDAKNDPNFLLVERLPGNNYRVPLKRFESSEKLRSLLAGDRVLITAIRSDNLIYKLKVETIIDDHWIEIASPQSSVEKNRPNTSLNRKITFYFIKWLNDKKGFQVRLDGEQNSKVATLQISALIKSQRNSYLWLKPGDKLHGHIAIAHEGVRFSEHGSFEIVNVTIGPEHSKILPEQVQDGDSVPCKIIEIKDDGFVLQFPNQDGYKGFLPNKEARLFTVPECKREDLLGISLIVRIVKIKNTEIETSYDQYLKDLSSSIPPGSILPGKVLRECTHGAIMLFPGFVCFVSFQNLLHGFTGRGVLPSNRRLECLLKEWHFETGALYISHIDLPDTFSRQSNVTGKVILIDPEYLIIQYEQHFGVINTENIPINLLNSLQTNQIIFIGEYFVHNKRNLLIRQMPSANERQKVAWQRIARYFPEWVDEILVYHWDRKKQNKGYGHDWMDFGNELLKIGLPITSETVSEIFRFLSSPSRRLNRNQQLPGKVYGDWTILIHSIAQCIDNLNSVTNYENDIYVLLGTAEYLLSVGEQSSDANDNEHTISNKDWDIVYDALDRIEKYLPGLLGSSIGRLIAGKKGNRVPNSLALVDEVIQRLSSNFDLFIQPYWIKWKNDIEMYALHRQQSRAYPIQKFIPGKLDEGIDDLLAKIKEGKQYDDLKLGRLYYTMACLNFVQQQNTKALDDLQEAENYLKREISEENRVWQQHIEELRILIYFISGNLNPRPSASQGAEESNLVTRLIRYCLKFPPDHTVNVKAFIFSIGLTLALKDFGYLYNLLEANKNSRSFFYYLLQTFLEQLHGENPELITLFAREYWLTSGHRLPIIKFQRLP